MTCSRCSGDGFPGRASRLPLGESAASSTAFFQFRQRRGRLRGQVRDAPPARRGRRLAPPATVPHLFPRHGPAPGSRRQRNGEFVTPFHGIGPAADHGRFGQDQARPRPGTSRLSPSWRGTPGRAPGPVSSAAFPHRSARPPTASASASTRESGRGSAAWRTSSSTATAVTSVGRHPGRVRCARAWPASRPAGRGSGGEAAPGPSGDHPCHVIPSGQQDDRDRTRRAGAYRIRALSTPVRAMPGSMLRRDGADYGLGALRRPRVSRTGVPPSLAGRTRPPVTRPRRRCGSGDQLHGRNHKCALRGERQDHAPDQPGFKVRKVRLGRQRVADGGSRIEGGGGHGASMKPAACRCQSAPPRGFHWRLGRQGVATRSRPYPMADPRPRTDYGLPCNPPM